MPIGKIVKISSNLGFIEYGEGERVSYVYKDYKEFKIGDVIKFDLNLKSVVGTDQTYSRAINLKSVDTPKPNYIRLNKALRELNIPLKRAIEFFEKINVDIEKRPTTKISIKNYKLLTNYINGIELDFDNKGNSDETESSLVLNRGTIVETDIVEVIHPSLIIVDFFHNQKAILPLQNLSWNIFNSQRLLSSFKVGDRIKVVVLENEDGKEVLVSRKHLLSRPAESTKWENLKPGQKLKGVVQEILINKLIVETELDFFGIINISIDHRSSFKIGDSLNLVLNGRDEINQFLKLGIEETIELDDVVEIVKEDFQTQDSDLQSIKTFKKSIYYSVANKDDRENVLRWFENDEKLFSSAITIDSILYVNFGFNTKAWENDFKNALLPYLGESTKEKDALKFLENQKYWVRTNTRVDNNEGVVKHEWVLFNERIYLSGNVFIEEDEYNFMIFNLSLDRTKKWHSLDKTNSLNKGTFLLNSKIRFLSPDSSRPLESNQKEVFIKIQSKVLAFETLNRLKKESGAILREEGHSISIFDKFLEYQEDIERKGNENLRVFVNGYKVIPNTITNIAIEIEKDVEDLFGGNGDENQMVSIRTKENSHRENRDKEFVIFGDALVETINDKTKLHLKNLNKPLDVLDDGFYIEPKVSLRQYQVQREVIRDFFDKKLKLDHIESLLVRPEKIKPPKEDDLDYINKLLEETEKKQPNNNQVKAVKKAVGNNNVFLIQGPPGTGKTTVIAEVVEQLIAKGEKVLVASQTHIAVDNVLEKVSNNKNISCIRLGNKQRIKENLRQYQIDNLIEVYSEDFEKLLITNINQIDHLLEQDNNFEFIDIRDNLKNIIKDNSVNYNESFKDVLLNKNYEFLEMLSKTSFLDLDSLKNLLIEWKDNLSHEKEILVKPLLYKSIDVAFATCIGVRTDKELNEYNLKFDTVIIDEAGKANISETLAAISMAKKVILVGDQMQLPPYIDGSLLDEKETTSFPRSKYGKNFIIDDIQHALKTSFFEFLVNRIKNNQFPADNKELLNYQHRMHPHIGEFISDSFYDGKVKMGEHTYKNTLPMQSPFDKEVVFINTSSAQNPYESFDGFSAQNDSEAYCISNLVIPKLLESGLTTNDFAVVAPYKSQVKHIKKSLKEHNKNSHLIEVSTLDSFQGMEFDVIVFSFTRAASPNQSNKKVGFLDDARRLNVAFSRAKKKLILVGNAETLTDSRSHYDTLFDYTGLFRNLVEISKKEHIGNFVNLTDFKDLKSNFQLSISKFKIGNQYNCTTKLSFNKPNYMGHIFYLEYGIEGMFRDDNKSFEFDNDTEYAMYISNIDYQKEHIYLTPNKLSSFKSNKPLIDSKNNGQFEVKLKKLQFFKSVSLGDIIEVKYKRKIDIGHFFEIEQGFDGFFYDPKMKHDTFVQERIYKMEISRIQVSKGRISLSIPNKKNGVI